MKRPTKREAKRQREQLQQEAVAHYTALLVQARMLFSPPPSVQARAAKALQVIETMALADVRRSARHLEIILTYARQAVGLMALNNHLASLAGLFTPRMYAIYDDAYAYKIPLNEPPKKRAHPVRPPTKIPDQAARFQNYRR